jgi:hypothetical protein
MLPVSSRELIMVRACKTFTLVFGERLFSPGGYDADDSYFTGTAIRQSKAKWDHDDELHKAMAHGGI